jgi:TRAP-type C4-dicarboxylate transport system permease small subunit
MLFRIIDVLDNLLSKFEGFMLGASILIMSFVTIAAVIMRVLFNDALTIADELNMILIVMVTFAGLSYAARNGRHIRMSAIYDAMSTKMRKIMMISISTITAIFMFVLAYYSFIYIYGVYESGRVLPALGVPAFLIYLWVPIGFTVTGFQYAFTVIKNIKEDDIYLSTNIKDGYCDANNDTEI